MGGEKAARDRDTKECRDCGKKKIPPLIERRDLEWQASMGQRQIFAHRRVTSIHKESTGIVTERGNRRRGRGMEGGWERRRDGLESNRTVQKEKSQRDQVRQE